MACYLVSTRSYGWSSSDLPASTRWSPAPPVHHRPPHSRIGAQRSARVRFPPPTILPTTPGLPLPNPSAPRAGRRRRPRRPSPRKGCCRCLKKAFLCDGLFDFDSRKRRQKESRWSTIQLQGKVRRRRPMRRCSLLSPSSLPSFHPPCLKLLDNPPPGWGGGWIYRNWRFLLSLRRKIQCAGRYPLPPICILYSDPSPICMVFPPCLLLPGQH